jgi:hypothetical protein
MVVQNLRYMGAYSCRAVLWGSKASSGRPWRTVRGPQHRGAGPALRSGAGYHATSATLDFGARVLKVSRMSLRKFGSTCPYRRECADRMAQNQ